MNDKIYSTIEHDYSQSKTYLSNYEFAYIEKLSKKNFIDAVEDLNIQDGILLMLEKSENDLNEIKRKGNAYEEEIKNISIEKYGLNIFYNEELEKLNILEDEINELEDELKVLEKNYEGLEKLGEIKEKIEKSEIEINNTYKKINEKVEVDEDLMQQVEELREKRKTFEGRQKRLSRMAYENCMEDIQIWYEEATELINNIFNYKIVKFDTSSGLELEVDIGENRISLEIKNWKLVDCDFFYTIENMKVKDVVEFAVKRNDPRIILKYLLGNS
ncbi:hypothetical protein SLOPH_2239 [Spraguea lophii 42_110]|uniref:Uncharacterized protein n=1 Tax=Spraguea lophii (strain 42_110) TaxID=1358809 RepID=S7WAN1_SPRLO|nr:hypothetical protein SLOPH_2239 [Spraguea lophii 42_110]